MKNELFHGIFLVVVLCCLVFSKGANAEESYLEKAKSAYENFDFEQALDLLSKASTDRLSSDKTYLASVHLYMGLVRFTLGQRKQAEREFAQALRLDFNVYPPDDTSPKILSAFKKVKSGISPPARKEETHMESRIKSTSRKTDIDIGRSQPMEKSSGRIWTWIMTGVGSAALVSAGVFAGLAAKSKGEFDEAKWASDAVEKRDEVEQRSLTANVLFGVGGAVMVGAVILFFVEDGSNEDVPDKSTFRFQVGLSGVCATVRF